MILWGEPLWLIALILPFLIIGLELLKRIGDKKARATFAKGELWAKLSPSRSDSLRRINRYLFAASLLFLILALANPRIGTRYEEVTREGIDIILAVDVSRSMDSQDIRPSRLGKTRYELARFLEGLKGDRIGLIPFSGTAYPLLPLTLDYSAARMFIDLLGSDLIPQPGTNIGSAIEEAMRSFPAESERAKAIIIISDGEDHQGDVDKMVEKAVKSGIAIYTIGMAQAKGDPIPMYDGTGTRSGWLTDSQGQIVTSKLNEELLRKIANSANGIYRRSGQSGDAFTSVYREIFKLDRDEFEAKQIAGHEDRFQPILLIALILLILQFILPDGRKMKKAKIKKEVVALLLLGFLAVPTISRADNAHQMVKEGNKSVVNGDLDEALVNYLEAKTTRDSLRPELNYNLGGVMARKGEYAIADSLWKTLPSDTRKDLLARSAYNRGTAYANAQQFDKAIPSFIESLKLNPDDMDTKKNLEIALRQLQEQEQQQEQNQDQDNKDQQEKEDQQQQDQQQNEEQDQEQDQQNQDQQQEQQDQQEQQQPNPEDIDKELAERLLDQLQQDEKELLKEVIRQQVPKTNQGTEKPW